MIVYCMQGNICPRFIFAHFPSLSAGEFKTERIPMSQLSLLKNKMVKVDSRGGGIVRYQRRAKVRAGLVKIGPYVVYCSYEKLLSSAHVL